MSLIQKRSALEKLANEIAELEKKEAKKIGKWILKDKGFADFDEFVKHYAELERVYELYLNRNKSETNVQNQHVLTNSD